MKARDLSDGYGGAANLDADWDKLGFQEENSVRELDEVLSIFQNPGQSQQQRGPWVR